MSEIEQKVLDSIRKAGNAGRTFLDLVEVVTGTSRIYRSSSDNVNTYNVITRLSQRGAIKAVQLDGGLSEVFKIL